jgi:YbbR domain-containing protein
MLNTLKNLITMKYTLAEEAEDENLPAFMTREKVLVFAISFILAFCLWFIVNLSRDFNITISMPLEIGDVPEEMALVEGVPDNASVGISGEGWKLISLYNNPPRIMINVEESDVNLYDKVQQQVSAVSDVNITQVQPMGLSLRLEEKVSKDVPVEVQLDIIPHDRFDVIGVPQLDPAFVTVSGAQSKVAEITNVRTRPVELKDVKRGKEIELNIERPSSGISVDPGIINYRFQVTEFTEGEVRIPIRLRNLPPGRAVTYNPSTVTIRYSVPIDQYSEVQNTRPFVAYLDYSTIEEDTTGLVIPQIERVEDEFDIRLRSFSPRTVSYFMVVDD